MMVLAERVMKVCSPLYAALEGEAELFKGSFQKLSEKMQQKYPGLPEKATTN